MLDLPKIQGHKASELREDGQILGLPSPGLFHSDKREWRLFFHEHETAVSEEREKHTGGVGHKDAQVSGTSRCVLRVRLWGGWVLPPELRVGFQGRWEARDDSGSIKGEGRYWKCLKRKQERMKD